LFDPPSFDQIRLMRRICREIVASDGREGTTQIPKENLAIVKHLIKISREYELARRYPANDDVLEILAILEQKL